MRISAVFRTIAFLLSLLAIFFLNSDHLRAETTPTLNEGKKWRIGYYEGGPYINYPTILRRTVEGLAELGWVKPIAIPEFSDPTDSKALWDFLVKHAESDYIRFVGDAYWSAHWTTRKRTAIKEEIITRLNEQRDIDLMIAAGTWAGQDLSNDRHSTPTMAVSVSDPVKSGMSVDEEHSGWDHFHVRCDPDRYVRQVRLFHRIVRFKRLGFVYENTVEGKTYAAYEDIYRVAGERHFSVVTCEAPASQLDLKQTTDRVIECHEKLAKEADAVFVTIHRGIDHHRMKELVAPFLSNKVPTWSQRGPKEVRMGLLYSKTKAKYDDLGRFQAEIMARTFNGEAIGSINQIFREPDFIAVNKKVAEIIGHKIPHGILRIADEVYDKIEYE